VSNLAVYIYIRRHCSALICVMKEQKLDGSGEDKARDSETYAYFRILNRITGCLLYADDKFVLGITRRVVQ
jgi:hypothetical protein